MVDPKTQQFLYRAVIWTVCGITGAIFVFLFTSALKFGDGEAVRIIDAMTPLGISGFGAMVTTVLGSHAAGAFIAKQSAQVSIASITTPAPASNEAGAA